jgi:hypothetical protein
MRKRDKRVGLDLGSILQTGGGILSSLFGNITIGDQVPDYPIKSGNTYNKLRLEVATNIPYPSSVDQAKKLIEAAQQLKEANLKRDNAKRVIDTIRAMYDEAIIALGEFIQSGGKGVGAMGSKVWGQVPAGTTLPGQAIMLPGATTLPATVPASGGGVLPYVQGKQGQPFPWLLVAGGVGLFLLTRKRR